MAITFSTIQAKVTKGTADSPITGTTLDMSTVSGDCMVVIRVTELYDTTGAVVPHIVFQLNWDNGNGTKNIFWVKELVGTIRATQKGQEVKLSIPSREFQAATRGTAGDLFQLNATIPTANTSATWECFLVH